MQRTTYMPLYVAFIYLTKAFDRVYSDGPFKDIQNIFCPPTLPSVVESFSNGAVQRQLLRAVLHSERCPTKLRSGSNAILGFFALMQIKCIRHSNKRDLLAHPIGSPKDVRTCCLQTMQRLRPTPRRNSSL